MHLHFGRLHLDSDLHVAGKQTIPFPNSVSDKEDRWTTVRYRRPANFFTRLGLAFHNCTHTNVHCFLAQRKMNANASLGMVFAPGVGRTQACERMLPHFSRLPALLAKQAGMPFDGGNERAAGTRCLVEIFAVTHRVNESSGWEHPSERDFQDNKCHVWWQKRCERQILVKMCYTGLKINLVLVYLLVVFQNVLPTLFIK